MCACNLILPAAILAAGIFGASLARANQLQAWAQMDARVAWHGDNPEPGSDYESISSHWERTYPKTRNTLNQNTVLQGVM
jgi:hypothetical protein